MKLIVVHQILIASAIGLALLFGIRAIVLFTREGAAVNLVIAAASVLLAGALFTYLRKVRAKWAAGRGSSMSAS